MCGPESGDVCKKDEELEINLIIKVTKWVMWEMLSVTTFPSGCLNQWWLHRAAVYPLNGQIWQKIDPIFNALITGCWFLSLLHKCTSSSSLAFLLSPLSLSSLSPYSSPLFHPPPPPSLTWLRASLTGSFSAMETPDGLAFSPQTRNRGPPTWPGATLTYFTRRVAHTPVITADSDDMAREQPDRRCADISSAPVWPR